jgi:hypothetical protein
MLLSKVWERDFVGNKVPENMVAAEERLDLLSEAMIRGRNRGTGEKNDGAKLGQLLETDV